METILDNVLVIIENNDPVAVKIFDRKKHCVISYKLTRFSMDDEQRLLEDAIRSTSPKQNVQA